MGSRSPAGTSLLLAQVGLYTVDSSDNATLVAEIANDTTLFTALDTAYTRSFDTSNGYPATYDLVAGQRYALGLLIRTDVGVMPGIVSSTASANSAVSTIAPRITGQVSGQLSLPTSRTSYSASNIMFWGRFS